MFTKRDLKNHLQEISTESKIIKFDFASPEKFTATLKCKAAADRTMEFYNQYSAEWIAKFSKFTATTWIVRYCFPKLKRLLYRKIYVCHRSSLNKKKQQDYDSRNQGCRARVDFRLKFINKNTIKNDPLLKEGLNLTISIDFNHTHKVRSREAFNLLKSTTDTDRVYERYFAAGCTPAAAKYYHELTLIDRYGEGSERMSNATINPTLRHVMYVYNKWKRTGAECLDYNTVMEVKKQELELDNYAVNFQCDEESVTIVTPSMRRVLATFNTDCVHIDTTRLPNGPFVTFVYVPTKFGALPVACNLCQGKMPQYQGLKLSLSVNKDFEPSIVVINDTDNPIEMAPYAEQFKVMTSRNSIFIAAWRWLNDEENKVSSKKRHIVMAMIKSVVYAESLESAEKAYAELLEDGCKTYGQNLREYVQELWQKRQQWMLFLDVDKQNSLVDASIRFNKEFILKRCKGFNVCVLVEVVAKILENHNRRIFASIAKEANITALYTKFLPQAKEVLGFGSDVRRISEYEYMLESQPRMKKYFRTDTMLCDCSSGKKGSFCEHLCAIVNTVDVEAMKLPHLTEDDRAILLKLADDIDDECAVKPDSNVQSLDNNDDAEEIAYDNDGCYDDEPTSDSTPSESWYYLDVKTENCDPLEDEAENDVAVREVSLPINVDNNEASTSMQSTRVKYETALKALNDEFRRLNRFFSENPNKCNLNTMARLARELSKIRPIEKVNLKDMQLRSNVPSKRKKRSE